MLLDGVTPDAFLSLVQTKLGTQYTEEQLDLIKSFGDKPTFCFADPGTGKTYTAVAGLLFAELYKQIPGDEIYAMSFTRLATGELAVRHKVACEKIGIRPNVNFSTLHKLCLNILSENYRLLGMMTWGNASSMRFSQAYQLVEESCMEWGLVLKPQQIKAAIRACSALNSALIFDEDNVRTKMAFKECNMQYKDFEKVRGLLYVQSILTESIDVSSIMLYTLMLMERFPEVSQKFKSKCKMMLVDEAQDLSLLHLRIISLLTDCPVFIGDMKQQIYAFNGACQEIVQAFMKQWPDTNTLKLTKSFRCKQTIADFATKIILPNGIGGEDFQGVSEGGTVLIHNSEMDGSGYNIAAIMDDLREDYITNLNKFTRDYLFLFRNNVSAIPIAEELYKRGLPFRVNKYTPAYDVPVIKEMVEILQLAESPASLENIHAIRYLIPEFRAYSDVRKNPLYQLCLKANCNIFEANYQYKDQDLSQRVMYLLMQLHEDIKNGAMVTDLFNRMWTLYDSMWVQPNEWKLEASKEYYLRSVNDVLHKPFAQFIQDEIKKQDVIKESTQYNRGVRCYTMHASKGLEADVVYIVDADDGILPNNKKLTKMIEKDCAMDAARALREERSLAYVACTRAKDELHIVFNNQLSPILVGAGCYKDFDEIYQYYKSQGDDVQAFLSFVENYANI